MEENNLLVAFSRLLIEDLALAPHWRLDVDIAADDAVVLRLILLFFWCRSSERIVQQLQDAAPDVCPAGEGVLRMISAAKVQTV